MLFLLFLLITVSMAQAMEQDDPLLLARKEIMRANVGSALELIKPGLAVIRQDFSGSYLLHWAVLKTMPVTMPSAWRPTMDSRMQVVDALLMCGADYTAQERDSKRTIFHILAYHISPDSREAISSAFDQLLKSIARQELVSTPNQALTEDLFVRRIQETLKRKDSFGSSFIDIVCEKKCVHLIDEQRIKSAYKLALAREVICY